MARPGGLQIEQVAVPLDSGSPMGGEDRHETLWESLAGTTFVLVIGLFLMTFLTQNYAIPSGSMEPTLLIGDHLVVDRSTLAPQRYSMPLLHYRGVQRGDIIVFTKPNPEEPDLVLVKRAIGLPGDRIHLEHGVLFRNGRRINEPQISTPQNNGFSSSAYESYRDNFPKYPGVYPATELWTVDLPNHIQNGDIVVPEGTVFAMGNNRLGSLDSRFWGFVPRQNIMGRPMFVYWSFEAPANQSFTVSWMVHVLTHFFNGTRWSRTGHVTR